MPLCNELKLYRNYEGQTYSEHFENQIGCTYTLSRSNYIKIVKCLFANSCAKTIAISSNLKSHAQNSPLSHENVCSMHSYKI